MKSILQFGKGKSKVLGRVEIYLPDTLDEAISFYGERTCKKIFRRAIIANGTQKHRDTKASHQKNARSSKHKRTAK